MLVIAPLVFIAHPLGLMWLLGAAAYIGIAEMLPSRHYQWLLCIAVAASLFGVHIYIWHHYAADPGARPFYSFNGADQLVLFGERYRVLARALLAFALVSIVVDLTRRTREPSPLRYYSIPIQLYLLAMFSPLLLPDAIHFPEPTATIALSQRGSHRLPPSLAAVCWARCTAEVALRLFGSDCVVFFVFLYQDTAIVNRMEAQAVQLVSKLPRNQRVLATIDPFPGSRILNQHIIDRACIGRCFSYGNYEPGSRVFRVRATPRNPYVLDSYELATETEEGDYLVEPSDLPLHEVYQCSENGTELCMRPLKAGEYNDKAPDE